MPRWDAAELPAAPRLTLRSWALLIGPGLVAAGAAIGGGEWLAGPLTTARYGGAILWLATVSILVQVIYNLEICRYTLYCGEPIFTGKFRVLPGPLFWLVVYVFLDFGSVFPYLVANAATPLGAVILGRNSRRRQKVYDVLGHGDHGRGLSPQPFVRCFPARAVAADLRRQGLQLAQGDHDVLRLSSCSAFCSWWPRCFPRPTRGSTSSPASSSSAAFRSTTPSAGAAPATDNIFLAWWQGRLARLRRQHDRRARRAGRDFRQRRANQHRPQRLRPRPRLGHGQARRRNSQHDRRAKIDALPRGIGISDQHANRSVAFVIGIDSSCAIS